MPSPPHGGAKSGGEVAGLTGEGARRVVPKTASRVGRRLRADVRRRYPIAVATWSCRGLFVVGSLLCLADVLDWVAVQHLWYWGLGCISVGFTLWIALDVVDDLKRKRDS
jgi:hypothetical protein